MKGTFLRDIFEVVFTKLFVWVSIAGKIHSQFYIPRVPQAVLHTW